MHDTNPTPKPRQAEMLSGVLAFLGARLPSLCPTSTGVFSIGGLPIVVTLSRGAAPDYMGYEPLLLELGPEPKVLIVDKG